MAWETKEGAMMARRVVSWRATTAAAEEAVVVSMVAVVTSMKTAGGCGGD